MTVNTTALRLQLLIGDDQQDWSSWYQNVEIGWESYNQGLLKKTGSIVIGGHDTPESLNIRANPSRWRPGQPITLNYWDGSVWQPHPLGGLVIVKEPSPPSTITVDNHTVFSNSISFDVGCLLTYYDFDEPDDDKSQVVTGTAVNSADVAKLLLEAGEVPVASINLGTWPYELTAPIGKQGGSFVSQAGDLAYSNKRFLYCDKSGVVRSQEVLIPPTTSNFSITLGADEIQFEPYQDLQKPVELARAVAVSSQSADEENPRTELFKTFGDPGDYVDGLGGYGIIAQLTTSYSTQESQNS